MSLLKTSTAANLIGCTLLIFLFNLTIGTLAAHYCMWHWLHKDLSYLLCGLIGFVGAEFFVPAAFVTLMLVLVGAIA